MADLYAGAKAVALKLTFRDEAGELLDLTAAQVEVRLRKPNGGTVVLYGNGAVERVEAGVGQVITGAADLDVPGDYSLQGWFSAGGGVFPSDVVVVPVYPSVPAPG